MSRPVQTRSNAFKLLCLLDVIVARRTGYSVRPSGSQPSCCSLIVVVKPSENGFGDVGFGTTIPVSGSADSEPAAQPFLNRR